MQGTESLALFGGLPASILIAGADLERLTDILAEEEALARMNPCSYCPLKVSIADYAVTIIV